MAHRSIVRASVLLSVGLSGLVLSGCPNGIPRMVNDSGVHRDGGHADTGVVTPDTGVVTPDTGVVTPDTGPLPDTGCSASEMACSGACIDPLTSATNCGTCSHACTATETCTGGTCSPIVCPGAQTRCGATCADTQTDNANCGGCTMPCPAGQGCMAGTCHAACAAPMMICTSGMMSSCLDPRTDNDNCGSCGNICMGGRTCAASACSCPAGRTLCGETCVDTATDGTHCGACGSACPAGISCAGSTCVCPAGQTLCGSGASRVCASTSSDAANCGTCGHACGTMQGCVSGACVTTSCAAGQILCSGTCVNAVTDNNNCGACGTACGGGTSCQTSACRPTNDLFASATLMTLGASETTATGNSTNALRDGATSTCGCTSAGNVWYRFTLAARAVVYFDTAGSAYDTSLFLTDSAGTVIANACNDDGGCGTGDFTSSLQSRVATVLAAGTYNLSVGGCGTGTYTLHGQQIPTSIGSFFYETAVTGTGSTSTVLVGASAQSSTCGGTASGEDVRWFMTCGGLPQFFSLCRSDARSGVSATYLRHSGTINYDPSMYMRSGQSGAEVSCNDDGISMGASNCQGTGGDTANYGSRLNNIVTPRGLTAVFVDERIGGSGMTYTLVYQIQ